MEPGQLRPRTELVGPFTMFSAVLTERMLLQGGNAKFATFATACLLLVILTPKQQETNFPTLIEVQYPHVIGRILLFRIHKCMRSTPWCQ